MSHVCGNIIKECSSDIQYNLSNTLDMHSKSLKYDLASLTLAIDSTVYIGEVYDK